RRARAPRVRLDPRIGGHRGRRLRDHAPHRPRVQPQPERPAPRPIRAADPRALIDRFLGDAALGDARGRMAAAAPRCRARFRRRPRSSRYLRGLMEEPSQSGGLIRATPALVRLSVVAWWRAASWAAETWVRAGSRVVRAAASGESPAELIR